MKENGFLEAGKIVNTHGVSGEVKIQPWTDTPEVFRALKRLRLDSGETLRVLSSRIHGAFVLAAFEGIGDINQAMRLKNRTVFAYREDIPLPEGGYFLADLVGMSVVSEQGEDLGTLTEVLEKPAHNVYLVRGQREILIPAVPAFILDTDTEKGVMTVRLIDGM